MFSSSLALYYNSTHVWVPILLQPLTAQICVLYDAVWTLFATMILMPLCELHVTHYTTTVFIAIASV
jgi:hypothetical protein